MLHGECRCIEVQCVCVCVCDSRIFLILQDIQKQAAKDDCSLMSQLNGISLIEDGVSIFVKIMVLIE